ncbi:MAG: HAD family phosphatase, partial [Verrucomicrobia bacterium]|nr:HAD family phosphatase [Verrucomicrobiota bacterium]
MDSLAVIFDWDGVITDSSGPHELAWELTAREHDLPLPEDHFRRGFGMRNESIIPEILNWSQDPAEIKRLADHKEYLFREVIRERGLPI